MDMMPTGIELADLADDHWKTEPRDRRGRWYHGTHYRFRPGEMITTGYHPNDSLGAGGSEGSRPYVYASNTVEMADFFAGEAANAHPGASPFIYEVAPTGPMEVDPELEEGGIEPEAYRSSHPLRVVREYKPSMETSNVCPDCGCPADALAVQLAGGH